MNDRRKGRTGMGWRGKARRDEGKGEDERTEEGKLVDSGM